jgi:hypothetical protein
MTHPPKDVTTVRRLWRQELVQIARPCGKWLPGGYVSEATILTFGPL